MRVLSLAFSFVLTATIATMAFAYVAERVGQNRIEVQDGWIGSSEPVAYQAYGRDSSAGLDSLRNVSAERADTGASR